jgi:hypothetical protein
MRRRARCATSETGAAAGTESLPCENVQPCILHDFRFSSNSIYSAGRPKLSDSRELWDTRSAFQRFP